MSEVNVEGCIALVHEALPAAFPDENATRMIGAHGETIVWCEDHKVCLSVRYAKGYDEYTLGLVKIRNKGTIRFLEKLACKGTDVEGIYAGFGWIFKET